MPKIRVLIVDDSVVIRRLLSDALSQDPAIEIVGTAGTGKIGLAKIPQVNPDLVTMDIDMPEMDGLTAVSEIRKTYKTLPIIMFSILSKRAAQETLEALSRGATDYVTKPANVGSAMEAMQRVRDELIPKIKIHCLSLLQSTPASSVPVSKPPISPVQTATPKVVASTTPTVLVIGVSTGGPNALAEVIPHIPADIPVPILIVQHMPPIFTKSLADRLSSQSNIPVSEGSHGAVVQPGQAWIAPGDFHMVVEKVGGKVQLAMNQDPQENSCRPAVDVLFRSVAKVYGAATLAVILTGMGQDGLRGCELISECGGQIVVQDKTTSVVWGMPGAVAEAGLAHQICPLSEIVREIVTRVKGNSTIGSPRVPVGAS